MFGRVATIACLFLLALWVCQSERFVKAQAFSSVPLKEISQFTIARDRSQTLRDHMSQFEEAFRRERNGSLSVSPEVENQLLSFRAEYFSLREIFFRLVFAHASGIIERLDTHNQHVALLRTSLSLAAGTELVKNFHTTGATISLHPNFRVRWDEPDLPQGILANSWTQSLEHSKKPVYRDFFRAGIERLRENQSALEGYWKAGDGKIRVMYPKGIEPTLQDMERVFTLFDEDVVEDYSGEDERELRHLVEESKEVRALWVQRGRQLREAIDRDGGLIRGQVRLEIYRAQNAYLSLRESLFRLAFKHLPKLTRKDIPYSPEHRLRGIGISLLAAVTLYENAQALKDEVLVVPEIRALLNQGDPVLGIPQNYWDGLEREFVKFQYRELLEAGVVEFEVLKHSQPASLIEDDAFLHYVQSELAGNPMVRDVLAETDFEQIAKELGVHVNQAVKLWLGSVKGVKYGATKNFMNVMGLVELRKGKLFGQTFWEEFVKARLKPGDILVEKSPFRLTERLVPGYFAHAALYVGTEKELRELKLLARPHIRHHLSDLSQGRTIAEALRNGTQLSSLDAFLDIDDLAILRPKPDVIPPSDVRGAIDLAFSHLGKRYDFHFDSNTWDVVTCSELIFQSYIKVPWSFGRVFGTYSVSPDDIAIFAGSDKVRPFSLITFIHKGRLIHDLPTGLHSEDVYIQLLGERYVEAIPGHAATRGRE